MDKQINGQLQMLKEIEESTKDIKRILKDTDKAFIVELVGTPKSGKTTLLQKISELYKEMQVPFVSRQETAEYNPISKDSSHYNTWMIMELYKNLCEDIENSKGHIVIYDRGILDRLPWLKKSVLEKNMTQDEAQRFINLYNLQVSKDYKPILYNFITSPELSIQRKGSEGKNVNKTSIENFNKCLLECKGFFMQSSSIYKEIYTDKYQGHLQDYIINLSYFLIKDLHREIKKEAKIKVKERDDV